MAKKAYFTVIFGDGERVTVRASGKRVAENKIRAASGRSLWEVRQARVSSNGKAHSGRKPPKHAWSTERPPWDR